MSCRHGGPAKVLGDKGRLKASNERGDFREVRDIQRHRRPQTQSDAVETQRIVASDLLQYMQVESALAQVILRMHFEPVHRLPALQKVAVMRMPKTDADADPPSGLRTCRAPEISWRGHRPCSRHARASASFPPSFSHAGFDNRLNSRGC